MAAAAIGSAMMRILSARTSPAVGSTHAPSMGKPSTAAISARQAVLPASPSGRLRTTGTSYSQCSHAAADMPAADTNQTNAGHSISTSRPAMRTSQPYAERKAVGASSCAISPNNNELYPRMRTVRPDSRHPLAASCTRRSDAAATPNTAS